MSAPIYSVRDGVIPAIVPSAPITEAHRKLACDVLLDHSVSGAATKDGVIAAAQLIADSEAAAVQIAMLREYGNLCATNESLAKERDRLRADCENETKWAAHYLADAQNARARAERAEGELAREREKVRALREACERLRDCDWVISLPDRMDAVRDIARAALAATSAAPPPTAPSPTETRPN
jgi:hypothetical protein